eukprot:IDg12207t1
MRARGSFAPLPSAGSTAMASLPSDGASRHGVAPSPAEVSGTDAAALRRKQSEKKRHWRQTRSEQQLREMRERDAERKRAVRDRMTSEQRRVEREKDARRKALKRLREKEKRRSAAAMSISRLVNQ